MLTIAVGCICGWNKVVICSCRDIEGLVSHPLGVVEGGRDVRGCFVADVVCLNVQKVY